MVRLREIPRTAAFAWSPGATAPWIATGTKTGAVDVDFSNETCLELWDLALDDVGQGQELKPLATVPTETGFHDLAWTRLNNASTKGIIAGALDSGSLNLWDVNKLVGKDNDALISSTKKHSGAIKALQFNPKHSNLLATGGAKGELYITDLNNADSPIRLGSTAARADEIDCLDWNKKVSHIMVTGSSGGFVTVWDMKTKKESLTLNNSGRKAVSAVAWDPDKPTKLITAIPLEQEPLILVWDLRNSNAPERTLRGHDSGVLSLSWCPQDSDLLLSCGKDNRTICWNPQTGQPYGDFPVVTNWTFQTRWNPHNPNLFTTASFDGKLLVQTLQNTNVAATQSSSQAQALDGEDFFSKAQTQPQTSSFSLPKAPKWLERPTSASFGFGGRLVSVTPAEPGKTRISKINITKFEVDSSIGTATDSFESAMRAGDLGNICQSKIATANSEEERADWKVIETLVSNNPRKELVDYLGIQGVPDDTDGISQAVQGDEETSSLTPQVNGTAKGHKRFTSIFESTPDGDFLAELSATKGAKPNKPFQIYTGSESESDRKITRALVLGQFGKALDVCIKEDRMSDAFMVAICGGEPCIQKAQEAYFSKQSGGPNYLRLLASVVGKNLWDIVHNAHLGDWKEVMATLCTFADEQEFPDLCEALGDRLGEEIKEQPRARKDASFCFLAGSKLEKVVSIWIEELKEDEAAGAANDVHGSAFSLHARGLQNFIEKVTVFRKVTNFQDPEVSKTAEWRLEALYSKYVEYADIVAAHGQLSVAERYLDLLPTKYPEADVARSRIKQATKKAASAPITTQQVPSASQQKPLPPTGGYQAQNSMFTPVAPQAPSPYSAPSQIQTTSTYPPPNPAQSGNPYVAPASTQPANPYAPAQLSHPLNPYAPQGGYQPSPQVRAPGTVAPPHQQYGFHQPNPVPPPPRAYNQSPSVPPPSKATNMSNWNDLPAGFMKPPTSRRGTPSVPPQNVSSPFPGHPPMGTSQQPAALPMGSNRRPTPPVAPPPKGPAPPSRVTSPLAGGPPQTQFSERSASSTSAYAQLPNVTSPLGQSVTQPPVLRGPSPYNALPSNAPPPTRYAPAPGIQPAAPTSRPPVGPPPQASSYQSNAPPMNPYAPSQSRQSSARSPYTPAAPPAQHPSQAQPQPPPPPSQTAAPQPTSRPSTANSEKRPPKPASTKHPRGDRSHIPENAQPIYSILFSEMARVKGRAPSSFKPQVDDTEKRLNYLFDHLNNQELLKPDTVAMLVELSQALQARDFDRAGALQREIHTDKVDECGNWMVGVKRLVGMCRATP